jgi:predicted nucleotidyltransferase component of viral defense system
MTQKIVRNLAASVRQRLLNESKRRRQPFDLILARYGIERLLYRLSSSDFADRFLLKGAMLFAVWSETAHRPTRDVDLLGFGSSDANELKSIFQTVCGIIVEADGLSFDPATVRANAIREQAAHVGVRVVLQAHLANVPIQVQIDVGFGDVVTPAPEWVDFPALLDFPAPRLRAYPIYTVVAEKLEAIVLLGDANTRLKDFFDLWFLSSNFTFEGRMLTEAIARTFARRQTPLPAQVDEVFSNELIAAKFGLWTAFVRRNAVMAPDFDKLVPAIVRFVGPPLHAASSRSSLTGNWTAARGWGQE